MLGEAYFKLDRLKEAEHWYREALRAKADHIPAHLTYGKLLTKMVGLITNDTTLIGAEGNNRFLCCQSFLFGKILFLLFFFPVCWGEGIKFKNSIRLTSPVCRVTRWPGIRFLYFGCWRPPPLSNCFRALVYNTHEFIIACRVRADAPQKKKEKEELYFSSKFIISHEFHRIVSTRPKKCSCAPNPWPPMIRRSTSITVSRVFSSIVGEEGGSKFKIIEF